MAVSFHVQHAVTTLRRAGTFSRRFPLAMVLCLAVAGCRKDEPAPAEKEIAATPPKRPNVVLITLDTTRADHCGCYGYDRETTPALDRLASRSTLFDMAYTVMPTTAPAHASLLTSQYPDVHGVRKNGWTLGSEAITLAEVMRAHGYDTAAFISGFPLLARFGFDQGFAHYDDGGQEDEPPGDTENADGPRRNRRGGERHYFDRKAGPTTDRTLAWLAGRDREKPYFAWVHYFDPHTPYLPPEPYRDRFKRASSESKRDLAVDKYDGEIRYMDDELSRLLDALAKSPGSENTLTIVVSDHGEGLYDHGRPQHELFLYEELVKVVFAVHWPGVVPAGRRVQGPAGLIDVFPTLVSLLDLSTEGLHLQGLDLAPVLLKDEEPPRSRAMFMQRSHYEVKQVFGVDVAGDKRAVRLGKWKFIYAPEEASTELCDLTVDPGEHDDIADKHPGIVEQLEDELAAWVSEQQDDVKLELQQISPEDLERLRSLGYVE